MPVRAVGFQYILAPAGFDHYLLLRALVIGFGITLFLSVIRTIKQLCLENLYIPLVDREELTFEGGMCICGP